MKTKRFSVVVGFLSLFFLANTAMAQQPVERPDLAPTALAAGAHSLSFALPGGGNPYAPGTLGYWMMLTPELNLGLNIGFALDRQEVGEDTITSWDVLLAPAVKYYTTRQFSVAPYIFSQLNIRYGDDGIDATDSELEASLALGVGAEWFPVQRFSVGGHVGLGFDILRPDPAKPIAVGTFTSGLIGSIYF